MSEFDRLKQRAAKAKDISERCDSDFHDFLKPIVQAAYGFTPSIDKVYADAETVEVEYGWSSRGCLNGDSVKLPRSVVEAADPIKAAQEFKAQREAAEAAAKRREKQAELKRLQNELGLSADKEKS